ncbi:hypothetical protein [Dyadobacter arcticus]|uniref:Uncharacterized protein n=1 Tax=Dyadobacter arcticus TaxID=1078754 RepID=A0ABX0UKZ6_9BACT|nr:hypothetical protein [Dyadobacter arcticus]NIJ52345.1 hypothetical protein [Dyadobacter arcticus]
MPTEAEVLTDWRYCDLKGPATVSKLGDIVLVLLEDSNVNPENDVLKFKDDQDSGDFMRIFKRDPSIILTSGDVVKLDKIEEVIAGFDEAWFNFTFANGFRFKNDAGATVMKFTELELPTPATVKKMNPIVP